MEEQSYFKWQNWLKIKDPDRGFDLCLRLVDLGKCQGLILTFLQIMWNDYFKSIDLLEIGYNVDKPWRALLSTYWEKNTNRHEIWSIFWIITPAQLKAMEK